MKIMHSEWEGRLIYWLRALKEDLYEPLGEIKWEAYRTNEQLSEAEAMAQKFEPVNPGFTWGTTYEYCWFRGSAVMPKEAKGQRIVMDLKPGGESTLFVNQKAFGTYRADWVNEPHHFMEDNVLTRCASEGETFAIMMETYAGHYFPENASGGCATGPVLPGKFTDPLTEGERKTLGTCTFGIWNEDAYQLYMDARTLYILLQTMEESSLRAANVAAALEQFTLAVDFEQDKPARIASYQAGREVLRPVLEAENGTSAPVFYAIGNAHLDLAWLWPMAETYRKTARTFAAQLRLIEEYPDYKFIQSQPAAYEMCRTYYPELFERIKKAIKGGQWIADGAMWVEPDTNMTSGESLIRQLIHGKRYYKDVLGVDSEVLWLPDTFGYTAALPQILNGCGVKYLVTQKIFWSYNEGEQFPYHYFTWEGMDGSKIVSFLPTSYTYRTDPEEVNKVWKNRVQMRDLDAFLFPFGYGDGGGGPARDYIEYAKRQENLEGGARVQMKGPKEFFVDMENKGGPKNKYTGELYFSAHRGTYTSQAMVKDKNRRCELALRELELWGSLAEKKGFAYPYEEADAMWKKLLLQQFHDILPGSSIARVYVEAEKAFDEILTEAAALTKEAAAVVAGAAEKGSMVAFNSLSFERKALLTLPAQFSGGAVTLEGEAVSVEETSEGVKALVALPACGYVTLLPAGTAAACESKAAVTKEGSGYYMENSKVAARINEKGEVVSFVRKDSGREFAAEPMNRLRLYKDVPRIFDAWDIDSNYIEQELPGAASISTQIIGSGLEAVLKVSGEIGNSTYTQYISLTADAERLEFKTEVDWKELHRLLKVSFPVEVYAENAFNEMQFGYVERPTHRSRAYEKDRFEVCNHRYTALCDGAHGAAVLNDSKYGVSMNGNSIELTLLRAASSPEMRADNRVHHFTYGFTAWEGSFADSTVVCQGYEMNVTPLLSAGSVKAESYVSIEKDNIVLDTVKPAEDGSGDLILRFYESKKAAVSSKITLLMDGKKAALCNMLEEKIEDLSFANGSLELPFKAFEVKTVRIYR